MQQTTPTLEPPTRRSEAEHTTKRSSADKPLRFKDRVLVMLASLLGATLIRLLRLSLRLEFRGEEHVRPFWERGENVILAFWHGRLLLLPYCYRGKRGIRVLISSSRDGELIARTIRSFGLDAVRGSSTRGGSEAKSALAVALEEGYDVGITPDGPKGPRYVAKAGVVDLARQSGRPVIPVLASTRRGKYLGSWDRFLLPKPGDFALIGYGAPVFVAPDEDFETARLRIEGAMNDLRRSLDAETGNPDPQLP